MFFIAICNSEYRYNGLPDALTNARPMRRSRGVRDTPDVWFYFFSKLQKKRCCRRMNKPR